MQEKKDLKSQVREWISKEGYPLEFKTANIFKQNLFAVRQGGYVKDFKTNTPRELDVIAECTFDNKNGLLRIQYVIECKWTGNKPWVIFSDRNSRISPGACIAQSIGSHAGEAVLWMIANSKEVQNLSIFHTPVRPGFNGRQAFSGQGDLVYSTLQSVMSACYSEKQFYDAHKTTLLSKVGFAVIILPIIIIDGELFEAFSNDEGEIEIEERRMMRLHWKGAEAWDFHSTIDVVTINHLPEYAKTLLNDTLALAQKASEAHSLIIECAKAGGLSPLYNIPGFDKRNIPPLLRNMENSANPI
jgi:hypothetical protein